MGAEIEKYLAAKVRLIAGSGGVFEVTANNSLIFSKKNLNRFPEPEEIIALLKKIE